jgi:homoserine O-succinyltransferase
MPVIVNDQYPVKGLLEQRQVRCLTRAEAQAKASERRPLRVGIINLMPVAEAYEFDFLLALGQASQYIEPVWIRLQSHDYKSSNRNNLDTWYVSFDEAGRKRRLDALVLTGAPVEDIPFEQIKYWNEVREILEFAKNNIETTLGLCWGALALAYIAGVDKVNYGKKLFGVFETANLKPQHPIMGATNKTFWCPQSRHAGIPDNTLEAGHRAGDINLLAHSEETGYVIFETSDDRFLMHMGHPEYNSNRLVEEAIRDRQLGRVDVEPPKNFDLDHPVNSWHTHGTAFFNRWATRIQQKAQASGGRA